MANQQKAKTNAPATNNDGMSKGLSMFVTIAIAVGVIGIIAAIVIATGFIDFITDVEGMQNYFKDLGFVGYLIYILLYIVVAVCMLPASAIAIVAGVTFGPILGGILSVIGGTLGAAVAFIVAKYIARDAIKNKFANNVIFQKIEKGCAENGVNFLILTRLVPVFPYNVQNYAYGVTNMNVVTFTLVSLITMAPGGFIYAYMAGEIVTNGVSVDLLIKFALAGIILFLISLIPKFIAKKKGIKMD